MKISSHAILVGAVLVGVFYFFFRVLYFDVQFVFDRRLVLNFLILSPVIEEFFFRGVVQKELGKKMTIRFRVLSIANIIASISFSLFHLIGNSPAHSAMVFFPSLVFGVVYERYRSVYPAMLLHSFYNLNVFFISV